ncbi:MAG: hypothetical protein JRN57_02225 [Nitrososphaerota archaeon]|nr:hypothetical protein [Nitrososphaerota archaeon]
MGEAHSGRGWRLPAPGLVLAALAAGIAIRALLLALPPLFVTDVAYYNVQAVGYILRGVDPYGASYSVPAALQTPGAANVFAYLPGVFVFLVPGGADARVGLVACDVVAAVSLLLFRPGRGGQLGALFLLFPPAVLFSTSFLNDSLPSIAFVAVALLLESRGRRLFAAGALGLALASSQEAWFILPVYLAYSFRNRSYAPPLVTLAVGGATLAPFAAWGPAAFVSNTLLFQFQRPVAPLFSAGPFGLSVNPSLQGMLLGVGAALPLAARGAVAAGFLAYLLWRSKGAMSYLAWGSAASVAVSLFVLAGNFYWSYLELPFVLLLFWVALRPEGAADPSTLKDAAR